MDYKYEIPAIDVDKSIEKKRLVYKITGMYLFNILITIFSVIPIAIFNMLLFADSPPALLYVLAVLSLDAWIIADLLLVNKLIVVEGISHEINQQEILSALIRFDNKMVTEVSNADVIIKFTPTGFFSFGTVVTTLFEGNCMYINISSIGKGNANISLFHAVRNYYKTKALIADLKASQLM